MRPEHKRAAAFTLIELVLVMALLIIVMSVTGTSLTRFFKGRTLESEGQRFVALTRHAQERAVAEGIPMSLWINVQEKKYGLEIAAGFSELDAKAQEFELGRDLEIEVAKPSFGAVRKIGQENNFRFNPDGFLAEANPETVVIKAKDGEAVVIAPNRNRLNYEITTNQVYTARR